MTTVQKFRDEVDIQRGSRHPVLSDAKNIFTLIDEAHRSEYGQFAAHMKMALPNACRIGVHRHAYRQDASDVWRLHPQVHDATVG